MKKFLLIAVLCISSNLQAQIIPSDTVPATVVYTPESGATRFGAQLRALRPIAGAPAPFYTYFWEFGDGGFSFEKDPLHSYLDSGSYLARLFATNNYDDGKRPPTRPKPVSVGKPGKRLLAAAPLFKTGTSLMLKNNCMPKPGDDMMIVLGYRNKPENHLTALNGTVAILYNDKEFDKNNFELAASRTYNKENKADLSSFTKLAGFNRNEKKLNPVFFASATPGLSLSQLQQMMADAAVPVQEQLKNFKSSEAWKFENLKVNEEHFIFLHFKTTPEMLKDTNATVRLTALFLPDDALMEKEFFTIELQIVASHDPNKMSIRQSRMNYRLTGKNRELTYKVRFQNTGKGPAKKIDVGVSLSEVFDPASIKIVQSKPEVPLCKGAYANQSCLDTVTRLDSIHFIFRNIYLPGTQQEGVNDADSTMGFISYKIKFKEKPQKLPIRTGAAIIFDKNEPIYTNRATGKFKTGISPAAIIGYGFPIQSDKTDFLTQKNFVLGVSVAPYAPHSRYLQAELHLSSFSGLSESMSRTANRDTVIGKEAYVITRRDFSRLSKVTTINVVPASLRYNLNRFIGAGVGALVSFDLNNTVKTDINYQLNSISTRQPVNFEILSDRSNKSFSDFRASVFADVVAGMVRVGPSIGLRYFYDPKSGISRMTTYATWKF
ncbi:PKD domain-containing protein [Pedobacter sp. MC2016-14]|uniref:PKD domain-containing protein n=1 Tax=Pedobacter sp. MC2016-14 TaxID=2897327 RepID=UPI001E4D73EE|nr:PKD domain-containing protein [Pedobacter sp. MC2016-14]MCD0488148.1 PKD domain-containing protein [Pedobacter sp. MC2016-14]